MAPRDSYPEGPDGQRRGYPVGTNFGTMYLVPTAWGTLIDNNSNIYPAHPYGPVLTVGGNRYLGVTIGIRDDYSVERYYAPTDARTVQSRLVAAAIDAVSRLRAEHPEYWTAAKQYTATLNLESANRELGKASQAVDEAAARYREALQACYDLGLTDDDLTSTYGG
jgi:hypothetical protein